MAVEVKRYKNTGLDYIQGKERVLFRRGGVIALVSDFMDWDSRNTVMANVLGLANRPECSGYDFDHAANTGQLRRKPHNEPTTAAAVEPDPVPIMEEAPQDEPTPEPAQEAAPEPEAAPEHFPLLVIPQPAKPQDEAQPEPEVVGAAHGQSRPRQPKPTKQKKDHIAHRVHSSPLLLLGVIVIVGLGSLVMSAYHIITYMHDGGRAQEIAITTGVVMTLFSAIAFTAARYFFNTRKISGAFIGAAFVAFGVIVIFFAMFSTIKVNYDQFKAGDEKKIEAAVAKSSKVQDASDRASFVTGELKRLDSAIVRAQNDVDGWTRKWNAENAKGDMSDGDLKWQYWAKVQASTKALAALQQERAPYAAEKLNKRNDVSTVEEAVKQEAVDATVFGMFAKLFGIDESTLKFIVYIIPAVFYDLMCPFALTVSFMLLERREDEIDQEEAE